jgi:16S rRNA (cytosine1402-N4)-methyltransferase
MIHKTVLLKESIEGLNIQQGDIYIDGTLGSGGHTEYALELLKGDIRVIGLDKDIEAIERSKKRLEQYKDVTFVESDFGDLDKVLKDLDIEKVDRIMLDVGLSSDQFETSGRGFTFKSNEPLLMTFKKDPKPGDLTAYEIVNGWQEESIADIIYGYGEERYSRRIAHAIILYREKKRIETTSELVEIIQNSVPFFYRRGRIHPATRTFQALRITVNDELNTLKDGLRKGFEKLNTKGRIAVISFHSLEDRIVKNFNKEKEELGEGKIITKKPVTPSEREIDENPRSRSAKLRILERI